MRSLESRITGALLAVALTGCARDVATAARASMAVAPLTSASAVPLDIEVVSPPPGSWVPGPTVNVAVVVRRPSPPASVSIGGVPATPTTGGFEATVPLAPGIASVTVLVTDLAGNVTATTASYMVGPLRPFSSPIESALVARLDASSALAPALVEDALDGIDFGSLLASLGTIDLGSFGLTSVEMTVLSVAHGGWSASATPGSGGFQVTATVRGVQVQVLLQDPTGSLIPVSLAAEVDASLATASTTASLVIGPGGPSVVVAPPAVALQGTTFRLVGGLQGPVASLALSLAQQPLVDAVQSGLSNVLATRLPAVLAAKLAALANPAPLVTNGVAIAFSGSLTSFDVSPSGSVLAATGDVLPAASVAGSPEIAGPAPVLGAGPGVTVALSPDLLARATTAAWGAGVLDLDLDAAAWSALGGGLPPLTVQGFSALVPELGTVLAPTTPLTMRVRPKLPPLVVVSPGLVTLHVGELVLELDADTGSVPSPALSVSIHGTVPLDVSVTGSSLALSLAPLRPSFSFSVVSQPLVAVDASALQARLSIVADALLPTLLASLQVPLPLVHGRPFTSVTVSALGPLSDWLAVSGDF
jgi:hypothetical protein